MKVKVHIGNAPHECDEARRLRGEVRRLRRALRKIAGYVPYPEDIAEAALAPRRKK